MAQVKWLALALMLPLMACGDRAADTDQPPGDSRNFFGRILGRGAPSEPVQQPLVPQVVSMQLEALPGGVILRTVGLPPQQGYWDANLERVPTDNPAVLAYAFKLSPPPAPTRVSTQQSREVLAGIFISDQDLAGIREVQIIAEGNVISRRPPR